jgi:hypothetical protein
VLRSDAVTVAATRFIVVFLCFPLAYLFRLFFPQEENAPSVCCVLNLQPTRPHLKIAGRASDFLTAFLLVHQLPKITRVDKTHFQFYEPAQTARETTETRSRGKN